MDFSIREANLNDLERIVELWRKLSIDQLSKDKYYRGSLEFNSGYNQMKDSILNNDCGMFVVEYKNEVQGFIEVWINRHDFNLMRDDCGYIVHYYVDNKARNVRFIFGVITRLYKAVEDWLRMKGKAYVISDAFEHNQRIIRLLRREKVYIYKTRMVREI